MTKRIALLAALAFAASGCSGSDGGGGGGGGAEDLSEFSAYCTGTLLVDYDVQIASGSGSWTGSSQDAFMAPAGTHFLVSPAFGSWEGYVTYSDGKAARIDSDFSTGLVKDKDFTSDCAVDESVRGANVLLQDATFYEDETLSGEPCTLPATTVLEQFGFSSFGGPASVSASAIKETCGWDQAYSDDIAYAELIPK